MAGVTYTDEEHRAIAKFAGWKANENKMCEGSEVYLDWMSGQRTTCGSASRHDPHEWRCDTPRPPLDDALAMACLRKLGEVTEFELSALDEWTVEIFFDAKWNVFGASDPRDAIFAAVLAYLGMNR